MNYKTHAPADSESSICGRSNLINILVFSENPTCKGCMKEYPSGRVRSIRAKDARNQEIISQYLLFLEGKVDFSITKVAEKHYISRQRLFQILQDAGVWKRHIYVIKEVIKPCVICSASYVKGKYEQHCKDVNHRINWREPIISEEIIRFLGSKGLGAPSMAYYFDVTINTIGRKLRKNSINNRDSQVVRKYTPTIRREMSQQLITEALTEGGFNEWVRDRT